MFNSAPVSQHIFPRVNASQVNYISDHSVVMFDDQRRVVTLLSIPLAGFKDTQGY
jgi:hypothetical protein